eukprot:7874587-Alexandrium_andersonii.AAC.1
MSVGRTQAGLNRQRTASARSKGCERSDAGANVEEAGGPAIRYDHQEAEPQMGSRICWDCARRVQRIHCRWNSVRANGRL